jgi:hypothetical protein
VERHVRDQAIDTRNLLYHFLQHDLSKDDVWLFQALVARLVIRLGIWLPTDAYACAPVLVPYARRDPGCRGDARRGIPDRWGAPDDEGYFRDDNSLVKGLPRSMAVSSTLSGYSGRRLGAGFVACHIWRELADGSLASRNPLTYSFVANIIWLPAQVAALTDREGSFAQQYLQAVAHRLFRHVAAVPGHKELIDEIWALLPIPDGIPDAALPEPSQLNHFVASPPFFKRRLETMRSVAAAMRAGSAQSKVVSRRFTEGIPTVAEPVRIEMASRLERYTAIVAGSPALPDRS